MVRAEERDLQRDFIDFAEMTRGMKFCDMIVNIGRSIGIGIYWNWNIFKCF